MKLIDIILLIVILAIVGAAVAYIRKAKKNGVKCIGCPAGCSCSEKTGQTQCQCGCHTDSTR